MFLRLFFFFIKSAFQPTEAKENNLWSRLELKEIKKKILTARENASDQVAIGWLFESDWFRKLHAFYGPITERSKALLT